jgi:hypothetical protein
MANNVSSLPVVLWIGLLAGTLDITENLIFNQLRGISPTMVFQYIASGLVARKAFQGALGSVALGVVLHYAIALIWTGNILPGKPRSFECDSPANCLWSALRLRHLFFHELRCSAAFGSSAHTKCGDLGIAR